YTKENIIINSPKMFTAVSMCQFVPGPGAARPARGTKAIASAAVTNVFALIRPARFGSARGAEETGCLTRCKPGGFRHRLSKPTLLLTLTLVGGEGLGNRTICTSDA